MKFCYKLKIFYLKDMLKYQFCRPNGYQWLNGAGTFLGLSRNTHQELSIQLNAAKNCYSTPHVVILAMHTILLMSVMFSGVWTSSGVFKGVKSCHPRKFNML